MKNQLSGIALILSGILFEVATVPTEVLGLYFFTSLFFALGLIFGVGGIVLAVLRKPDDEGK